MGPYSYQESNAPVSIERTATSAVLAVLTGASSLLILPIDSTVVVILIGDFLIGDDSVDLYEKNNNNSSSFVYSSSKNSPRNHTCNRKFELKSENNKIKTKERPPWWVIDDLHCRGGTEFLMLLIDFENCNPFSYLNQTFGIKMDTK